MLGTPKTSAFILRPSYPVLNSEGNDKPFAVTAITVPAQEAVIGTDGRLSVKDVKVTLIPYYAWNHRGAGKMDVWLARSLSGLDD